MQTCNYHLEQYLLKVSQKGLADAKSEPLIKARKALPGASKGSKIGRTQVDFIGFHWISRLSTSLRLAPARLEASKALSEDVLRSRTIALTGQEGAHGLAEALHDGQGDR